MFLHRPTKREERKEKRIGMLCLGKAYLFEKDAKRLFLPFLFTIHYSLAM